MGSHTTTTTKMIREKYEEKSYSTRERWVKKEEKRVREKVIGLPIRSV